MLGCTRAGHEEQRVARLQQVRQQEKLRAANTNTRYRLKLEATIERLQEQQADQVRPQLGQCCPCR